MMMMKMNTVACFTVVIHVLLSSIHSTMALDNNNNKVLDNLGDDVHGDDGTLRRHLGSLGVGDEGEVVEVTLEEEEEDLQDSNDNDVGLRRRLGSWLPYRCTSAVSASYREGWDFKACGTKSSAATKNDARVLATGACCITNTDGFELKRYTTIFGTKDWYYKCCVTTR